MPQIMLKEKNTRLGENICHPNNWQKICAQHILVHRGNFYKSIKRRQKCNRKKLSMNVNRQFREVKPKLSKAYEKMLNLLRGKCKM